MCVQEYQQHTQTLMGLNVVTTAEWSNALLQEDTSKSLPIDGYLF